MKKLGLFLAMPMLSFASYDAATGAQQSDLAISAVEQMVQDKYQNVRGLVILPDNERPGLPVLDTQKLKYEAKAKKEAELGYKDCADKCTSVKKTIDEILSFKVSEFSSKYPAFPKMIFSTLGEIDIPFHYSGIPFLDKKDILFYSATSNGHDGHEWGGVGEKFKDKELGICGFSVTDISSSIVFASEEELTHDLNGKITEKMYIYGNPEYGFTYAQRWYKDTFSYSLHCMNMKFDKKIKNDFFELAKKIDSAIKVY